MQIIGKIDEPIITSRLSHKPLASFPRVFADNGATSITSAQSRSCALDRAQSTAQPRVYPPEKSFVRRTSSEVRDHEVTCYNSWEDITPTGALNSINNFAFYAGVMRFV